MSWRRGWQDTHALNMQNKDENKSVSLTTAKINYMDPRVTVAWCKRNEVRFDVTWWWLRVKKLLPRTKPYYPPPPPPPPSRLIATLHHAQVGIERIFPATLRDKFNWAMSVPEDFEF
jgi:hypothetical protein